MAKRIGFIGAGNMAGAIIRGIISAGAFSAGDIIVADVDKRRVDEFASVHGVVPALNNTDLVIQADIIVLSVKPQVMHEVLEDICGEVKPDQLVISIAAGYRIDKIAVCLGDVPIIRVMPNTPALVGEGVSALYSANASEDDMAVATKLFEAVGQAVVVDDEGLIDAVTAVSGSGPAYFFLLMEEMIKAGVDLGLSKEAAATLVLQTAKGAGVLAHSAADKGEMPEVLRKQVTSPGGTTQAAIESFQESGFGQIVEKALTAARDRSVELS